MLFKNKSPLNTITISLGIAGLLATTTVFAAVPSLDGSGNNPRNATLGAVGTPYSRISQAAYPDGIGQLMGGPKQ